jgi:hypothetical protein
MRRRQLLEIEDQSWCPAAIRDGATDYLQFVLARGRPYRVVAERLGRALVASGSEFIVDLGSGAGGPWIELLSDLRAASGGLPGAVVLTDLYPNRRAAARIAARTAGQVTLHSDPVDAAAVPAELRGFRTLFTSFHHFEPRAARSVLADAARCGEGIAVFEVTERRWGALAAMLLVPFVILAITPWLRPLRFSRLLWTYVLPAIPLVGLIDGMVSCLRSYEPAELLALAGGLESHSWEAGKERAAGLPLRVTYLIGVPRASGD